MVWMMGLFPHLKVFTEAPDSKATAPTPTLSPNHNLYSATQWKDPGLAWY